MLRKVGSPPGQNQFYYNLVKSLLERVAPVMIDAVAIKELVGLVGELLTGFGPVADTVENASEKGIKLLLVCLVLCQNNVSSQFRQMSELLGLWYSYVFLDT